MLRPMLDEAWVDDVRDSLKPLGQQLSQLCQRDSVHDLAEELVGLQKVHQPVQARLEASIADREAMLIQARESFAAPAGVQTEALLYEPGSRAFRCDWRAAQTPGDPVETCCPAWSSSPGGRCVELPESTSTAFGSTACASGPGTFATPRNSSLQFWGRSLQSWRRMPPRCNTCCAATATPPPSSSGRMRPGGTITR